MAFLISLSNAFQMPFNWVQNFEVKYFLHLSELYEEYVWILPSWLLSAYKYVSG